MHSFVKHIYTIILMMLIAIPLLNATPDYPREERWADEVIPGLIVGDAIYLTQKNNHRFLGVFAEAENPRMGLIIVHGMGLHPDWGMISSIRQRLYDYGYTTLSIQMPILAADADYKAYPKVFPEASERLQVAVQFLKQKGYPRIVIVSHSNGSRMSRVYMATNPPEVNAWVALSLTQGDTFDGIKAPVFDLYGENDLPHVLSSVNQRRQSFSGNPESKQKTVAGADHFFNGHEDEMISAIRSYLDNIK